LHEEATFGSEIDITDTLHTIIEKPDKSGYLLFGSENVYSVDKASKVISMSHKNAKILSLQLLD
jgi:hypothetical protein